ncbi:unnamed protein product [Prorocentrum cordatum]|uniref:Phospholipase B-like n=1 Tax=Prorocentrum cordatum TaxID=2364126 RepID=A0ABN9RS52_9DINO|nr:unnamed protein product [Polarella glacialis]
MPRLACSPGMGRRATRPYTFPWCHASALLLIASLAPTGQHAPDCARGAVGPVWGGLALAQRQKLASRLAESRRVTAGGGEKDADPEAAERGGPVRPRDEGSCSRHHCRRSASAAPQDQSMRASCHGTSRKEGDWRESSCYSPWPPLVWEQGEPAAKEHGSLSDRDACRAMHSVRAHCWRGWTANVRSELESSSAERGRASPVAMRPVRPAPSWQGLLARPCRA